MVYRARESKISPIRMVWAGLRISMGWIYLWAFIDKLFGLGYATSPDKAWLHGASPTMGFLFSAQGPLQFFFKALSGQNWVDWLFMLGLFLIGAAFLLGVGVRIAGYSSALLVSLMWLAVLPPSHNPLIDEHVIYVFVSIGLTLVHSGCWLGIGRWWSRTWLVKSRPFLE